MLTSIAIIFLTGLFLGAVFGKLRLPSLIGFILTGILIGPYAANLIDESILGIAADLRQIALVIILTRAGLSLNLEDLKRVGRPAVLMCFVPACFEMLGVVLLAPGLLGVTRLDAAIIGSVIAAVSPAVVVPRMIRLINEGYGKKHSIPQLILAGAAVDDVFVIVVFTAFTGLAATGEAIAATDFLQIPVSIAVGIAVGCLVGAGQVWFYKKFHMRDSVKLLIMLSLAFLMLELQDQIADFLPMSGLLAIMSIAIMINRRYPVLAKRIQSKYNKLWVAAELMLFVLVGATVDMEYALTAGVAAILLVCAALLFRMAGVFVCVTGTKLTPKERLFCMVSYTPKATVQAGIGAVPLAMGLSCGQTVLTVAVLSILITAPFGAVCMDNLYGKLLEKEENEHK